LGLTLTLLWPLAALLTFLSTCFSRSRQKFLTLPLDNYFPIFSLNVLSKFFLDFFLHSFLSIYIFDLYFLL